MPQPVMEWESRLGRRYGYFELSQYDRGRFECGGAAAYVVSGQKFIRTRINHDAVIAARRFNHDETHSGRRASRLFYMSDIDAFIAVEAQRHVPKSILPNPGDEVYSRSEPGATNGLVGTLAAVVHAIARS